MSAMHYRQASHKVGAEVGAVHFRRTSYTVCTLRTLSPASCALKRLEGVVHGLVYSEFYSK